MNIFTIYFYKILAKYSSKRTKLHHFNFFSRGSMPPNPLNKREAPCKYPNFPKNILNPPPPPPPHRNEILDTPLFDVMH